MSPRKNYTKRGQVRGEAHYRAQLTTTQVIAIFLSNDKCLALASEYNVSLATIYNIKNHRAWVHITKQLLPPSNWRRGKGQPKKRSPP